LQSVPFELKRTPEYPFVCVVTLGQRSRPAQLSLRESGSSPGSGVVVVIGRACEKTWSERNLNIEVASKNFSLQKSAGQMDLSEIPPNTVELIVQDELVKIVLAPEEFLSNEIHDVYRARLQRLQNKFDESSNVDHGPTKGSMREGYLLDLFRDIVPSKYAVEGGFICDIRGNKSRQLDFIIANTSEIPPVALESDVALIPAEAALITLEIKSTLRHSDREQIEKQVNSINQLGVARFEDLGIDYGEDAKFSIPTFIFAFESDLSRDAVDEWLLEIDQLMGICIFGSHYKLKHGVDTGEEYKTFKIETHKGEDLSETMIFIFSLLRAASLSAQLRKRFFPVLPLYIRGLPESVEIEVEE